MNSLAGIIGPVWAAGSSAMTELLEMLLTNCLATALVQAHDNLVYNPDATGLLESSLI